MALVGEHHQAILGQLAGLYEHVAEQSQLRVGLLTGEAGVGKSTLLREFYEYVRATYDVEGFWPAVDRWVPSSNRFDPGLHGKLVGPPASETFWSADVLPHYIWWDICCRNSGSTSVDVVAEGRARLPELLTAGTLAINHASGQLAKFEKGSSRLLRELRDVATDADSSAEAISTLFESNGVWMPPGLGLLGGLLARSWEAWRKHHARMVDLANDVSFGSRARERALSFSELLADSLSDVAHKSIPLIVVIDDAQWMHDSVGQFLRQLYRRAAERPVLVLVAAWPEATENRTFTSALSTLGARRVTEFAVEPLDQRDFEELILSLAPHTTPTLLAKAARKFTSVQTLTSWLSFCAGRIENANGALSEELLTEAAPSSIGDRWNFLGEDVQRALALSAAVAEPTSRTYIRSIVARAASTDDVMLGRLREAFLTAEDAGIVVTSGGVDWLLNQELAEHAQAQLGRFASLDAFHISVLGQIEQWLEDRLEGSTLPFDQDVVVASEAALRISETCHRSLNGQVHGPAAQVAARSELARMPTEGATERFKIARRIFARTHHESSKIHIDTQSDLAFVMDLEQRYDQAIAELKRILGREEGSFERLHQVPFATRFELARLYKRSGNADAALQTLEALIADWGEFYMRFNTPTGQVALLEQRLLLARWKFEADPSNAPVEFVEELIRDGRRSTDRGRKLELVVWNSRFLLGECLDATCEHRRAAETFAHLAKDSVLLHAPGDEETLLARHWYGRSLSRAGQHQAAFDELSEIVPLRESTHTEDHPRPLDSRFWMAKALYGLGEYDEAIEELRHLIPDRERVIGPLHAFTLDARQLLGESLDAKHKHGEAVDVFAEVAHDRAVELRPDHEDTLYSRHWYAGALSRDRRFQAAFDELSEIIPMLERVHGADDHRPLKARYRRAWVMHELDSDDAAIEDLQSLVPDCVQGLRAHHETTLDARELLGVCLDSTHAHRRAADIFAEVATDRAREFGPEDESTLRLLRWGAYAQRRTEHCARCARES